MSNTTLRIETFSSDEINYMMSSDKIQTEPTEHQSTISQYRELVAGTTDGAGFFIPCEYKNRAKLRRQLSKAALLEGSRVEFKKSYRGGELVKVVKQDAI